MYLIVKNCVDRKWAVGVWHIMAIYLQIFLKTFFGQRLSRIQSKYVNACAGKRATPSVCQEKLMFINRSSWCCSYMGKKGFHERLIKKSHIHCYYIISLFLDNTGHKPIYLFCVSIHVWSKTKQIISISLKEQGSFLWFYLNLRHFTNLLFDELDK